MAHGGDGGGRNTVSMVQLTHQSPPMLRHDRHRPVVTPARTRRPAGFLALGAIAGALVLGTGHAAVAAPRRAAQQVTIVPPESSEPPQTTEPAPVTTKITSPPTTARPKTAATRVRTTSTAAKTPVPAPTTTLFTIPGEVQPLEPSTTETTLPPVVQDDDLPTWSINLFWIGIGGALAILVATYVLTGRNANP